MQGGLLPGFAKRTQELCLEGRGVGGEREGGGRGGGWRMKGDWWEVGVVLGGVVPARHGCRQIMPMRGKLMARRMKLGRGARSTWVRDVEGLKHEMWRG